MSGAEQLESVTKPWGARSQLETFIAAPVQQAPACLKLSCSHFRVVLFYPTTAHINSADCYDNITYWYKKTLRGAEKADLKNITSKHFFIQTKGGV